MTDKEINCILKDMVIICDSREKKNQHILEYFDCNNIPYISRKLDTADYSFFLPNYPNIGLDECILVEKKNSLDEIVGNFTKDRERFKREFERVENEHVHLVIENASWKKVLSGTYRSSFPPKSLMASILTFSIRYDFHTWFCTPQETGELIYNILYYELREQLLIMQSGKNNY